VSKIRGDDCDRINAIGSRFLARHHFLEIAVCPIGGDAYQGGTGFGPGGIGRDCARDQFVVTIKARRYAMHAANERAGSTAHHAEAQPAPHRSLALSFDGHLDFSYSDAMPGRSGERSGCSDALQQIS
jgi:hypothetical protein